MCSTRNNLPNLNGGRHIQITAVSNLDTVTMASETPTSFSTTPAPSQLTPESSKDAAGHLEHVETIETSPRDRGDLAPKEASPLQYDRDSNSEEDQNGTPKMQKTYRTLVGAEEYTEEEEQAIIRKFDRKLVVFLAGLYMLSFLDRSNIGNARIAGMDTSLGLSSSQYSWLLTVFYITYIGFEWMILLYRLVPAHIYISVCVLSWGVVASLQSLSTSFAQMLFLRCLLGIGEAAFGPGIPFYMTFFYRRSELAYRVGLQISAAPLASSFASSLAWLIVKINRQGPIEPWRALFLFEGFPSIFVAILAWYYIPDSPSTARYLTPRQRKIAKLRLRSDATTDRTTHHHATRGLQVAELIRTLLDPKAYLTALMFFSVNVAFSSLPPFLPTVIHDMNFSSITSQALAAPPYLFSFAFVLLIGHLSDKHPDSRAWYIIAVSLLSSLSYGAIALAGLLHSHIGEPGSITIRYIGVHGAAMGFFSAVTLIITWTLNNQASASGKGMGITILNVIGQCGPLVGVRLFPRSQAPYYTSGMTVCASFMLGVAVLAAVLRVYLIRLNRRRNEDAVEYEMVEMVGDASEELMGQHGKRKKIGHAAFRFML